MTDKYKSLKVKLSSWNRLRRVFYGRKNETISDYLDRISVALIKQPLIEAQSTADNTHVYLK